jgi:hypothetical protein
LISTDDPDQELQNTLLKLTDFGCKKEMKSVLFSSFKGSIVYMAPEVFHGQHYDESSDIWSVGIVIYQLLTLSVDTDIPHFREILKKSPHYIRNEFADASTEVKKLAEIVYMCLQLDPGERATASELLAFLNDAKRTSYRKSSSRIRVLKNVKTDADDDVPWNILSEIRSDKGRKFWQDNGWERKAYVPWLEFLDAYQQSLNYVKMEKPMLRGLKRLLCNNSVVNFIAFDEAIENVGYPFNSKLVEQLDYFKQFADEEKTFPAEIKTRPLYHYLTMLIQFDMKKYVDIVSYNVCSLEHDTVDLQVERLSNKSKSFRTSFNDLPQVIDNAIPCLMESQRAIVYGLPFSGKTLLLRRLALEMSKQAMLQVSNDDPAQPYPKNSPYEIFAPCGIFHFPFSCIFSVSQSCGTLQP